MTRRTRALWTFLIAFAALLSRDRAPQQLAAAGGPEPAGTYLDGLRTLDLKAVLQEVPLKDEPIPWIIVIAAGERELRAVEPFAGDEDILLTLRQYAAIAGPTEISRARKLLKDADLVLMRFREPEATGRADPRPVSLVVLQTAAEKPGGRENHVVVVKDRAAAKALKLDRFLRAPVKHLDKLEKRATIVTEIQRHLAAGNDAVLLFEHRWK